jgi:hypothetical protein
MIAKKRGFVKKPRRTAGGAARVRVKKVRNISGFLKKSIKLLEFQPRVFYNKTVDRASGAQSRGARL